ncbi:MAG: cyclic nucleotide-binding domain-containing protein [Candidatus Latescibacteria bacterium]|nr:cyclic nucleotide-binding domain-containing protein [Candidatus Latescibacterota bacterium]
MLTVVEKVISLQDVDIFSQVPTEQLAALAAIAREEEFADGEAIYQERDPADAMFLLVEGQVCLLRGDQEVQVLDPKDTFGTWALFVDEPRLFTAVARGPCRLLKLDKEDFIDLLADNVAVTQGVLTGFVNKIRPLLELAGGWGQ